MVGAEELGISITDNDEEIKKQLLSLCIDLYNDIDYNDFDGYDPYEFEGDAPDDRYLLNYICTMFYDSDFDPLNTFLLFNLLFPKTFLYSSSEEEYADSVTLEEIEEAEKSDNLDELSNQFELKFYNPNTMMIESYIIVDHEYIIDDHDRFDNISDPEPIKRSIPDKNFILSIIEKSEEEDFTELTELLNEKCKEILASDDPLDGISFDEDDDDDFDEDDE